MAVLADLLLSTSVIIVTAVSELSYAPQRGTSVAFAEHDEKLTAIRLNVALVSGNGSVVRRSRRDIDRRTIGFTEGEKIALRDAHNAERRRSGASDMMKLRWDDTLEQFAQEWASGCRHGVRVESQRSSVGEYAVVGENIYVTTQDDELPVAAVSSWIAEKDSYDYEGNECRGACGFYKAVVWAETRFLGCGLKYCLDLQGSPSPGYYVVCDYGPAADPGDRRPFKKGDACLDCPDDARDCFHDLCYDRSTWSPGENLATRLAVNCISLVLSALIKVQFLSFSIGAQFELLG